MKRLDIFMEVIKERRRQDEKWGPENVLQTESNAVRMTVLTEEVGEVAKAILEGDFSGMKTELIQVAAVVFAWLESPDLAPEYIRASGEGACADCGRYYREHPFYLDALFQGEPWLNQLCDGTLVKL